MAEAVKDKFGFVAVQLSRKMWQGNNKLDGEEIGVNFDGLPKEVKEIVTLGHKKMYPKEWRDTFIGVYMKAYHYLQANSLPFITDHIRAVPKAKLAEVMARLELFQKEYMEAKEAFIANYELIKIRWEAKYKGPMWDSMAGFYPHKDALGKKFDLFWTVFEVTSATYSTTSVAEVQVAYTRAKQELNRRLAEMVEESITYLRAKVSQTVSNLANRLRTGGICNNATLDSVRNVEQWFNDLNLFGDKGVESDLKTLREALRGVDSTDLKDNAELTQTLIELSDKVAESAGKLEDINTLTNTYKRTLEI